MNIESTPPPANVCTGIPEIYSGVPDYYLGFLIYYDDFDDDNCRWVVYDGANKVRCPTRRDAIDYIVSRKRISADDILKLMTSARISINRAMQELEKAATYTSGTQRLLLERLAVKLRPFLVDLDNCIIN